MTRCTGMTGVLAAVVAWVIVQSPRVAAACAVCTAGRDEENQAAFLWSTLFMSLLPLMTIGTLVFVIRRRYQKLEAETAARELEAMPLSSSSPSSSPSSSQAAGAL